MNTKRIRILPLLGGVRSVAALAAAGCSKNQTGTGAMMPPAQNTPAAVAADRAASPGTMANSAMPSGTMANGAMAMARPWTDLETMTYDRRSEFAAGIKQMETTIDRQVAELTEKRAAMKGTVAVKDWDFAMKEMNDARTYLKSMGDEAAKATAETWDQQKAKVGQAWKRAQAAYEKVQLSTTS